MARYTIEQVNKMLKRAGYNRMATAQDLAAANRFGEKVFAKTRDKIFNAPNNKAVIDPVTGVPTAADDVNSLVGSVSIRTPEEIAAAAGQLYNPYFDQLGLDLQGDYTLSNMRNTEDFNTQQQFDAYGNAQALGQATAGYNNQFGSTFGSPLQQKLEQERLAQQGLQQGVQQRNFQRRQYDIGEILRKGQLANTAGRQQAIGEYVATNQFQGL